MKMNYKIKESIANQVKQSYAKEQSSEHDKIKIDCGEGVNPLGCSELAKKSLKNIDIELINNYPHMNIKNSIIDYWKGNIELNNSNIILGEGSVSLIYVLNRLFINEGTKILGYSPQFSEFVTDLKICGGVYDYVLLESDNNYKFNVEELINKITEEYSVIYIDNPNNPTGQIIPLEEIEKIIVKAKEFDICVIVDEAYGEYMEKNNSSINLINKYDNVIILRTFSKGWGLAGLRAGYMIVDDKLMSYISKITNPYMMTEVSRFIVKEALKDAEFINKTRNNTKEIKEKFLRPWNNLKISETSQYVSIMLVEHKNVQIDLEKEFNKFGIDVVSGNNFIGIDKNAIRFRIPKEESVEEVIKAFENIDKL